MLVVRDVFTIWKLKVEALCVLEQEHPDCQIFGQTVTTNHHDELEKLGIKPSLKETEFDGNFSYVIFCAPPSQSPDYAAELR